MRDSEVKEYVEAHEDLLKDIIAEIEEIKDILKNVAKRLDELEEA